MLAHGHPDALEYPIALVWEENQLIVERITSQMATEASILHSAITTGVAAFGKDGGKSARASFAKLIKGLVDGA